MTRRLIQGSTEQLLVIMILAVSLCAASHGQQPANATATADRPAASQQDNFRRLQQMLDNVRLVGRYTVVGKEAEKLREEEYFIRSATKMPVGDLWLFQARLRYADTDVTLPLPLPVKWLDHVPVISLNDLTIPGLGTFSAHVVLHDDKYAGTWVHGQASGHLFGTIEKLKENQPPPGK